MTVDKLIEELEELKKLGRAIGQEQLYIGDEQQETDYFVRNADGKLTLKQEWMSLNNIKMKIEITSSVLTDEIIYQLQQNLSTKQLVEFVLQIGDNLTDAEKYFFLLKEKLYIITGEL